MDLNKKFNVVVDSKKIRLDYLANDLTTVESSLYIPGADIFPYMVDLLTQISPFVTSNAATWGAIFLDKRWEEPTYQWVIPYANINLYNTGAKPIFATIVAAINSLVDSQSDH